MAPHEPLDPATAAPTALCPQGRMHARAAVAATVPDLQTADLAEQATVGHRPRAFGAGPPCVVAARRHLEHAAHEAHRVGGGMLLDEGKPHLGTSAKMPMAFFNTSRSMRV